MEGKRPLAWVALMWFMTTFWLLGDLGLHPKEFYPIDRNPVTGAIYQHYPWHMTMLESGQTTQRCLCILYMNLSHTLFYYHWPWRILVTALLHGLVCWSLYRLLRLLRLSTAASAAATLLFLTVPATYQTYLMPTAGFILLSTYLFFMVTAVYLTPTFPGRLPALIVLAGASFCFYEITIPVYPFLPLLYAAVHGGRANKRMLVPIAWLLGVAVLYAAVSIATRSPVHRGGLQSFIPLGSLGPQLSAVWRHALDFLCLHGLLGEALRQGWGRLSTVSWVVCAAAACGWISWWNKIWRREADTNCERRRLCLILAFGFIATLLPWLLVVSIRVPSWSSRIWYFPLLGTALTTAAALDLAGGLLRGSRSLSRLYWSAVGGLVLAGSLWGAIAVIGVQTWIQQRGHRNMESMAQLQQLVPHPPPGAYFLPIALCPPPPEEAARTLESHLNGLTPPIWGDTVGATRALGLAYHRNDIACWMVPGKTQEEAERWPGLINNRGVFASADARSFSHPVIHTQYLEQETRGWKNVIPFTVDCALHLQLIGKIRLEHADNRDEEVLLPWVRAAASRPDLVGEVTLSAPRPAQVPGSYLVWQWNLDGQPVSWNPWSDAAVRRRVAWLSSADLHHAAMYTVLLPSREPVHLYFRFSSKKPGTIAWYLSPGAEPQRGTLTKRVICDVDWNPVTLEIEPHDKPRCLLLKLEAGLEDACAVAEPITDIPAILPQEEESKYRGPPSPQL